MPINLYGSFFHQVVYFGLRNNTVVGFVVNDADQVVSAFESLHHIVPDKAVASGY
jgi:hypothetical protein